MSWSFSVTGRANKLAEVIRQKFVDVKGCNGLAEEAAKNELGGVAETLCKSLKDNPVVQIDANGSAWNEGDQAKSQAATFNFKTLHGNFIE